MSTDNAAAATAPLFRPELADAKKKNGAEVKFPMGVTYLRTPVLSSSTPGGVVENELRHHVTGLGHMTQGVAKALINSLYASVRQAELDDRAAAKEAAKKAARAAKSGS